MVSVRFPSWRGGGGRFCWEFVPSQPQEANVSETSLSCPSGGASPECPTGGGSHLSSMDESLVLSFLCSTASTESKRPSRTELAFLVTLLMSAAVMPPPRGRTVDITSELHIEHSVQKWGEDRSLWDSWAAEDSFWHTVAHRNIGLCAHSSHEQTCTSWVCSTVLWPEGPWTQLEWGGLLIIIVLQINPHTGANVCLQGVLYFALILLTHSLCNVM